MKKIFRSNVDILGIDPGPVNSAYCVFRGNGSPSIFGIEENAVIRDGIIRDFALESDADCKRRFVIEQVQGMGMAIGNSTIDTIEWIGRFRETWDFSTALVREHAPESIGYKRGFIKGVLCGKATVNDSNIRHRLIEMFGGYEVAIGVAKDKGPLHGMSKDEWQALAVVVTDMVVRAREKRNKEQVAGVYEL